MTILALITTEDGQVIRPADIEVSISENLYSKFVSALEESDVLSIKEETLVAIDMKETAVVRTTEAFVCNLAVQVAHSDMEGVNEALQAAFETAFEGNTEMTF